MGKRVDGKNPVEKELVVEVVGIYRNFFVSQRMLYDFSMLKIYARPNSNLLLTRSIRVDPKIIFA